jgi:type IV pilus biogenesis protein CpaD/CtpE
MSGHDLRRRLLAVGAAMAGLALAGCADMDKPATLSGTNCVDPAAAEIERLGCANEANLESMVANPADLETPAALGRARGDAAFEAARRHREGRVDDAADDAGDATVEAGPGAEPQ